MFNAVEDAHILLASSCCSRLPFRVVWKTIPTYLCAVVALICTLFIVLAGGSEAVGRGRAAEQVCFAMIERHAFAHQTLLASILSCSGLRSVKRRTHSSACSTCEMLRPFSFEPSGLTDTSGSDTYTFQKIGNAESPERVPRFQTNSAFT